MLLPRRHLAVLRRFAAHRPTLRRPPSGSAGYEGRGAESPWPRFLGASLLGALVIFGIAFVLFKQSLGYDRALLEERARSVVALELGLLYLELRRVHSDLLYLAHHDRVRTLARRDAPTSLPNRPLGDLTPNPAEVDKNHVATPLELNLALFTAVKGVYASARVFDTEGNEHLGVRFEDGAPRSTPAGGRAPDTYFPAALLLSPGEVLVSQFALAMNGNQPERPLKPVIHFTTQITDDSGDPVGLFSLSYLGGPLFQNVNEISAGFPGSVQLINSLGHYLHGPEPEKAWGWILGHSHSFRDEFPDEWRRLEQDVGGTFETPSGLFAYQKISPAQLYEPQGHNRGVHGFAAVSDSAFYVVSRVPRSAFDALRYSTLTRLLPIVLGAVALIALLAWFWANATVSRKANSLRLRASEQRLRQLSSQLLAAQETERRSLSRDIHDGIGQQTTAVLLELRSGLQRTEDLKAKASLTSAVDGLDAILRSVHELASRLRPSVLDDIGLAEALETLSLEFEQRTSIRIETDITLEKASISPTVKENVYRIVQEALSNVASHAHTDEAAVTVTAELTAGKTWIVALVEDGGVGFDARQNSPSRLGLLGMRERIGLLGGDFSIESSPGEGTRIRAAIPAHDGELAG